MRKRAAGLQDAVDSRLEQNSPDLLYQLDQRSRFQPNATIANQYDPNRCGDRSSSKSNMLQPIALRERVLGVNHPVFFFPHRVLEMRYVMVPS
jgi:hypothetical protein